MRKYRKTDAGSSIFSRIFRPYAIGGLAIAFAASLWALDGAVLRPSLYHLDPYIVVFLEHLIAFLIMLPFLANELPELKKLGSREWSSFIWVALFGGAIGTIAITKAYFSVFLDGVSSISVVVLLQKTQPLFAIILAYIILREKPRQRFYFYAGMAMLGSYLVAFGFSIADLSAENRALFVPLFALLAAFAFGSSTVFGKQALSKVNFRVATYIRFGLTSLIMLLLIAGFSSFANFTALTSANLITLVIIALSTGGAAIFIYYYGLKRVQASKAAIYELMYPVAAIILEYFLHGKILGPGQWLGAVVLVFSMIMVTGNSKKKQLNEEGQEKAEKAG